MALPRRQLDEVAADVPGPLLAREEVLNPVRGRQPRADGKDADTALHGGGIEIDDDDDVVLPRALEVAEELLVLRLEERDVVESLQRRVLAPHPVERRYEWQ